jgi:alkylated DNA nucleotide flippase Atl1
LTTTHVKPAGIPRSSDASRTAKSTDSYDRFRSAARVVPEGFWTAYGEIALAATGSTKAARAVARCASRTSNFPNAWRVIHADGSIPNGWGAGDGGPERCRRLLEAEGVRFANGRADPEKKILADELELLLAGVA